MKIGQQLTENGIEVALFPAIKLIANQHKDYIACDFGGVDFYAPNKVIVKRNSSSAYHGVYFWTVEPVLTKDHGITHLSYLLLHDNDVSDLPVGKIIEQGNDWYQRGGFGPNGAKTYGTHIHLCVAIGHTLKTEYVNGHQQLVGAVYPDQIFFINDTEIVKTSGMNWEEYIAPVIEIVEPIATETSCEEQKQPIEVVIVEPIIVVEPIAQPTEEIIEPVRQEPIQEPTQIIEEVPINNTTIEKTTPKEPVNVLYLILRWLIKIISLLLKGK